MRSSALLGDINAQLSGATANAKRSNPRWSGALRRQLSARAVAMLASWPAAWPTAAFLELLLGPANAAFPGGIPLGILNPADELVSGKWRDVLPGI